MMQKFLLNLRPILLSFVTAIFFGYQSCANASLSTHSVAAPAQVAQQKNAKQKAAQNTEFAQKVLSEYRQWAGTRYRLGGSNRAGIDCSAFVKTTMGNAFNVSLPRSTAQQKHSGKAIKKSELRPGDLVFFRKNHHVGVYIGGGKFVHASTSHGVTTNSLSEKYWAKTYTQSRRVM